jgi:hypothetical protein
MKKLAVVVAMLAVVAFSGAAMATGFIEGWADTATVTKLNAGAVASGCGSACEWGMNSFMESAQAGQMNFGLKGCASCGTGVSGEINAGYDTTYSQDRDIPGG